MTANATKFNRIANADDIRLYYKLITNIGTIQTDNI